MPPQKHPIHIRKFNESPTNDTFLITVEFTLNPESGYSALLGTIGDADALKKHIYSEDGVELPHTQVQRISYINNVIIEEELQGQGIGSTLVKRFIELSRSEEVDSIFLQATDRGELNYSEEFLNSVGIESPRGSDGKPFRLVRWYETLGFKCVEGEDPDYYPIMEMSLSKQSQQAASPTP